MDFNSCRPLTLGIQTKDFYRTTDVNKEMIKRLRNKLENERGSIGIRLEG